MQDTLAGRKFNKKVRFNQRKTKHPKEQRMKWQATKMQAKKTTNVIQKLRANYKTTRNK